jgi:hypothetical protein
MLEQVSLATPRLTGGFRRNLIRRKEGTRYADQRKPAAKNCSGQKKSGSGLPLPV